VSAKSALKFKAETFKKTIVTENENSQRVFTEDRQSIFERRPSLVFLRGELLPAPIPLERNEVLLGRALEADVRIIDPHASRLHARIIIERDSETEQTRYRITDLGSTNGVTVNGRKVMDSYLQDGDKIGIGEHILRFDLLDDLDREFQQRIHRLIVHDELTGLLTSKSFFSELRREAARAEQEGKQFSVLMMDLDHFKSVNDTFGHLIGSQTLETVGALIRRSLRAGDTAARFGGEEFAAFLLDADAEQGKIVAERVRREIEDFRFSAARRDGRGVRSLAKGQPDELRITISIGIASYPADSRDPIELVEMADAALYHAKRSGRNRTCAHATALAESETAEDKTTSPPLVSQSAQTE
jgi:diguanylate cyclase (GGDEF)-like protein